MKRPRPRHLHHQLFIWFALVILVTVVLVALMSHLVRPGAMPFTTRLAQVTTFAATQFAERWSDPQRRDAFAREIAATFDATLWLKDASGRELTRAGSPRCRGWSHTFDVVTDAQKLGEVRVCFRAPRRFGLPAVLLVLLTACLVLWAGAALIARHLTRPLSSLIGATREIGSGNLGARVRLGRHPHGELRLLAESINDMAGRIEQQMRDQRELLAAVSHEVRSPLARLRVCAEILRGDSDPAPVLDAVEREITELDALVGKLLASSRLDFETLTKTNVVASRLFTDVLQRRQLPPGLLIDETGGAPAHMDATLIARALDNLLDNASRHGSGPTRCVVRLQQSASEASAGTLLVFEVLDAGAGFAVDSLPRVFDAFFRGRSSDAAQPGSLGLGLALVRRIAEAHGGTAWAENLPTGGARVGFGVRAEPRAPAS